jgi:hypothetical protein
MQFVDAINALARGERRGSMLRSRVMLGSIAVAHGVSGLAFDYPAGISYLVTMQQAGWLYSACLIVFGSVMFVAAIGEWAGHKGRWCREFSAALLMVTWIAVFKHSFEGGADSLTILAPMYFMFTAWSWYVEARAARRAAQQEKQHSNELSLV